MYFRSPPSLTTERGHERHVGIEVEFAGLRVEEANELVTRLYGGAPAWKNRFESIVSGSELGDFRVEVDSIVLAERTLSGPVGWLFGDGAQDMVDEALASIGRAWIPCEIVSPPIPISRLHEMETLRAALHAHNARGTRASVLYGFALQLNPEVPSTDADSLLRHLQAFLTLYDWLEDVTDVDVTRRIGPFITPFPDEYRQQVLSDDYAPDLDTLIADYLSWTPTRNRPLDLLPLFSTLRPEQVRAAVGPRMKINPRPTFHYRLPNSLVDEPSWSFAVEWNRWCEVERLAADPPRLRALSREWAASPPRTEPERRAWITEIARTLH